MPLVKAIKTDVRGRKVLMTRKVARKDEARKCRWATWMGSECGSCCSLMLKSRKVAGAIWECLYGWA